MKKLLLVGKKLTDAETRKIKGGRAIVDDCKMNCDAQCTSSYLNNCPMDWSWCMEQAMAYCDPHCASICKDSSDPV